MRENHIGSSDHSDPKPLSYSDASLSSWSLVGSLVCFLAFATHGGEPTKFSLPSRGAADASAGREGCAGASVNLLWLPKVDAPFLALNHPTIVGMFHEYQPSNMGIPHFKKTIPFTIIDHLFLNLASYAEDAAFIEHFGLPGPRRFAHLWSICHKLRG